MHQPINQVRLQGFLTEPETLAELAKGRLRAKRELLEQALAGTFQAHHRFMLIQHVCHIFSPVPQPKMIWRTLDPRL